MLKVLLAQDSLRLLELPERVYGHILLVREEGVRSFSVLSRDLHGVQDRFAGNARYGRIVIFGARGPDVVLRGISRGNNGEQRECVPPSYRFPCACRAANRQLAH